MILRLFATLTLMAVFGLAPSAQSDLDAFMSQVLARRDENWKKLQQYTLAEDPSQILVMIVVDERAAGTEDDLTPGPMRRVRAAGMWMPILSYADGYGLTYGARIAFIEPLGRASRVSVPLTWGGERRAGVDLERTFEHRPFSVARGSAAASRRVNPHFDLEDERLGTPHAR